MPTVENRLVIPLVGDIDHHQAALLRQDIDAVLCAQKPDVLELDLQRVSFMDSSGIGLIMGRYRLLQGWNGRLILSHLSDSVRKLVLLAGLGTLPIFDENRKEGSDHEAL